MSTSIKNAMEEYNLIDAPVRHLRPYVSVLDGQSWTGQSAADFFHTCDITDCSLPATHTEGGGSTWVCTDHCTCFKGCTGELIHSSPEAEATQSISDRAEMFLSESKLSLYWDRVKDPPKKRYY